MSSSLENLADFFATKETEDTTFTTAMRTLSVWETSPDRWMDDPETLPDQAPDVAEPSYHQHPLAHLTDFWTDCEFSPRFQTVLNRLHGVLVKDGDPRALQMSTAPDGQALSREQVTRPDGSVWRPRGDELRTHLWTKILVLLEMTAAHLASRGELPDSDRAILEATRLEVLEMTGA